MAFRAFGCMGSIRDSVAAQAMEPKVGFEPTTVGLRKQGIGVAGSRGAPNFGPIHARRPSAATTSGRTATSRDRLLWA